MANKHLTLPPSDVMLARLKVFMESVNDLYSSGSMVLEADIVSSFHEVLNLFFETLDGSVVSSVLRIYPGAAADPSLYNQFTSAMLKDAQAIFSEINALDQLVSAGFNSIASEYDQALKVSKRVSDKLGDYLLYADPKLGAGYFFGDSFSTKDKIEIGSALVDTDECYVDTDEGVVVLPLDGEPDTPVVSSIIIGENSNGEPGNNYQVGVVGHEDIEVVSDDEANTWFEYEKVTTAELQSPLVLDLTITLEELSVINYININPVNFGTPTPIRITVIETSKDGKDYTSIKDQIPVKDYVPEEDQEDSFELSAATSKYSGQGFYSFLPRKVQYVHVVFEQHTPYTIETVNGSRLRYAIGIRDINIRGRKFLEEGSLVSIPFTSEKDITKVSIFASENPTFESELADVLHFVSHNDGALWSGIQPQGRTNVDVPEIVNFNNIADNAIETTDPVRILRHKISMSRNKKAFKGETTVKENRLEQLDIVTTAGGGEFSVALTEQPIEKSINIVFPFMGSFSCPRPRAGSSIKGESVPMDLDFVEFNVDAPGERVLSDGTKSGTIRFKLPFNRIPDIENKIRVFVNGEQIEHCPKTDDAYINHPGSYTTIDEDSKVYFLNRNGKELQFGVTDSNDIQRGYIPAGGSKIQVCLDGDNPFLRLTDRGYVLHLTVPSDGEKDTVGIVCLNELSDNEAASYEIEIPPGTEKFRDPVNVNAVSAEAMTTQERQIFKSDGVVDPLRRNTYIPGLGVAVPTSVLELKQKKKFLEVEKKKLIGYKKDGQWVSKSGSALKTDTNQDQELLSELDHQNQDIFLRSGSFFTDAEEGFLPPVFLEGTENFDIIEYDSSGNVITGASRKFTTKVEFKDGDTELRDPSSWEKVESRYTFDSYTGTVYLGSKPYSNRRTVLVCKKRDLKVVDPLFWSFDKNQVTGRINTQKILLDPRAVYTMKRVNSFTYTGDGTRKITLVTGNEPRHDWHNSHVVRGTVKLDNSLFDDNVKPIEIKFVNGEDEFSNINKINGEVLSFTSAGGNLYTAQLSQIDPTNNKLLIGSVAFAAVRSTTDATASESQFNLTAASSTPASNGQWTVSSTGLVTLYLDTGAPNTHTANYRVQNTDPGLDTSGMYSIDYDNATVYFADPINADGNATYEVSAYSCFYNIAQTVQLNDIDSISAESKKITFTSSFGMKFLKQDTIQKARPQILKIFYEYYKRITESLEDLEPYFSPICKDLAFRGVTTDLLEEL
jgi:hypothetical protein